MLCEAVIASDFPKKIIPLIDEAKNSLDICVFDWRWYPSDPAGACQQFNNAIVRASKRGVKVRAIVNNDSVAQTLKSVGVETKRFRSAFLLHCKLMILDEKTVVTGSHNYTQSAFSANYELSVILSEPENIADFQQFFKNLFRSYA